MCLIGERCTTDQRTWHGDSLRVLENGIPKPYRIAGESNRNIEMWADTGHVCCLLWKLAARPALNDTHVYLVQSFN